MLQYKKYISVLAIAPFTWGSFIGLRENQNSVPPEEHVIAQKEMSLDNRYGNNFVNDVFKNNILLNLAYLKGKTASGDINWDEISKPFKYEFLLEPGKTFAYHEDVKDQYKDSLVKTTNAHFNSLEGFKTDGYLFGDGVCHLASLLNWVAKEANLEVEAPTSHDFANIPDIPKEYGVSIYSTPGSKVSNSLQNLYITNNKDKPIIFKFSYENNKIKVAIAGLNS